MRTPREVAAFVAGLIAGTSIAIGIAACPARSEPTPLASYVDAAITSWVPPRLQPEGEDAARARYAQIASDVVEVVSDPAEQALFAGDEDRHTTALLVVAIALAESRFSERVDLGNCRPDECDGRRAWSMWQIHPDEGLVLDTPGWRYGADGFHGLDLAADRKVAVRCFLHVVRGRHDHRYDSDARRSVALEYAAAHPYGTQ